MRRIVGAPNTKMSESSVSTPSISPSLDIHASSASASPRACRLMRTWLTKVKQRNAYLNPWNSEAVQHFLCIPCQPVFSPTHGFFTLVCWSFGSVEHKKREKRKSEEASTAGEQGGKLRVLGVTMASARSVKPTTTRWCS
jgi:hypothetical protein